MHCKKTPETILQLISSYFDTTKNSHNDINIEFIVGVIMFLCITKNMNQNHSKIPCFVEKIKNNN
jgi:hypothetical protein